MGDTSPVAANVVAKSEAPIEFLAGVSWKWPGVAAIEDDEETSCPAVGEESSSTDMHSESMDGGLLDAGKYIDERCILRLRTFERLGR
jgi:hypothetical protein